MTSHAQLNLAGVCPMTNGPASLSAAASLAVGKAWKVYRFSAVDLLRLFVGGFLKIGKRSSGGITGVRRQKEKLVHAVKNKSPPNPITRG